MARTRDRTLDVGVREAAWVRRARAGDGDAMRRLIERHRAGLGRLAANLLRDVHAADDVAQEAFLKAFRELPHLRDDRNFRGFLFRIAARLCLDRLRRRRPSAGLNENEGGAGEERLVRQLAVERVLLSLSPEARAIIVLREIEGFSYDEIAAALDVPVGTVRSRLHVARERFRRAWKDGEG